MPTYDYECGACGHKFELFQSITAKPTKKCPGCGRASAKRLIGTGAGVIFRGSGFYCTDYRSDSYKSKAKAETDSGTSAAKSNGDGAAKTKADGAGKAKTDGSAAKKAES